MRQPVTALCLFTVFTAACHRAPAAGEPTSRFDGVAVVARDTIRTDYFEAAGVANPVQQATLSTRLMATVLEVGPVEGARVARGDLLVRLDAADLTARRGQAAAAVDDATSMRTLARLTADRMRAMYADSAASRAQLDAAESALARANSQLAGAHQAIAEVDASARYAEIRAPFAGVITRRLVDPGAFAAPGTPLVSIEATDQLRVSVTIPAALAPGLRAGHRVTVRLEGVAADAVIEGVVPSTGNLYTVNALVDNRHATHLAGSAATLLVPSGSRHVILVPAAALRHQGDLVGVWRRFGSGDEVTWVTIGATIGADVEVLSGLAAGDSVLVPATIAGAR